MNDKRRISVSYGLLCLGLGSLWLLNTLGRLPWQITDYVFSWRFLLVVIGLFIVIKNNRNVFGLLVLAAGLVFSATYFWELPEGWEDYLPPAALMLVGVVLLFKPGSERKKFNTSDVNTLNRATIFGDFKHQVTSVLFKGGYLTAVFGNNVIDFTQAHLGADEVYLEITSVFGSNAIIVPPSWDVKLETTNILGSSDDKRLITNTTMGKEGTLIIKGTVLFGDFKVKD